MPWGTKRKARRLAGWNTPVRSHVHAHRGRRARNSVAFFLFTTRIHTHTHTHTQHIHTHRQATNHDKSPKNHIFNVLLGGGEGGSGEERRQFLDLQAPGTGLRQKRKRFTMASLHLARGNGCNAINAHRKTRARQTSISFPRSLRWQPRASIYHPCLML